MNNAINADEIDLKYFLKIIGAKKNWIITSMLVFLAFGFLYAGVRKTSYAGQIKFSAVSDQVANETIAHENVTRKEPSSPEDWANTLLHQFFNYVTDQSYQKTLIGNDLDLISVSKDKNEQIVMKVEAPTSMEADAKLKRILESLDRDFPASYFKSIVSKLASAKERSERMSEAAYERESIVLENSLQAARLAGIKSSPSNFATSETTYFLLGEKNLEARIKALKLMNGKIPTLSEIFFQREIDAIKAKGTPKFNQLVVVTDFQLSQKSGVKTVTLLVLFLFAGLGLGVFGVVLSEMIRSDASA